jgi:hypothetical protein
MTIFTDVRARLLDNGYMPIPCNGKTPPFKSWQNTVATKFHLANWERNFPAATNTGLLTANTPALDVDVHNADAVDAAITLVREKFGDRGKVMLRYGRRPKVAIPFRTDKPFKKFSIELIAPDGAPGQKLEFLGDGQQVVVHGVHPDTGHAYEWSHDGNPGEIRRRPGSPRRGSPVRTSMMGKACCGACCVGPVALIPSKFIDAIAPTSVPAVWALSQFAVPVVAAQSGSPPPSSFRWFAATFAGNPCGAWWPSLASIAIDLSNRRTSVKVDGDVKRSARPSPAIWRGFRSALLTLLRPLDSAQVSRAS